MTNNKKTTKSLKPTNQNNQTTQELSKQDQSAPNNEDQLDCSENEKGEIVINIKGFKDGNFSDIFGTKSFNVSSQLLKDAMNISAAGGEYTNSSSNLAFDFIKEIKPQDPLEAMLAIQMLGTHLASCKSFYRANLANQTQEMVSESINRATKLSKTFIAQMEALKKHRSKGDQKITVEHINVNDGGKVSIGETNTQINNCLQGLIDGGVGIK